MPPKAAPIAARQRRGQETRGGEVACLHRLRSHPASQQVRPCWGCSPALGVWLLPPLGEGELFAILPPFMSAVTLSLSDSPMSLLGSYRKKTNNDGYESLQLVDSNGDFCSSRERTGGGGGGGSGNLGKQGVIPAVVAAARSPARQHQHQPLDCSTMDSSGTEQVDCLCAGKREGGRVGRGVEMDLGPNLPGEDCVGGGVGADLAGPVCPF